MGGRDPRIKLGALELEVFRYFLSFFFSSPPFIFFFLTMKKKAMDMALNRNLMGNVTYKTRYSVFPWNNNNRGGGGRQGYEF